MIKNRKNQRIAERPLLVLVDKVDKGMRSLKVVGVAVGLSYPSEPPTVTLMGPNPVQDHLAFDSTDGVLPLPDLPDILEGVEVSEEARDSITASMAVFKTVLESYREKAKSAFLEAYDIAAKTLLNAENLTNFYL